MRNQTLTPPVIPGYEYVRALGSGGFADVFLFHQFLPRRTVAVKVLRTAGVEAAQLSREVDVMASLSAHPSILTVYDASISGDGRPYMVMEYCPQSLGKRTGADRMPVQEVLSIGIRMCAAVEAAHRVGVLHRDIKPSNILITQFGHPVLADFGVATMIQTVEDEDVAMSIPWSAPEIISQASSGSVATDVWALAATVYSLAAGRAPFAAEDGKRDLAAHRARIARAKYNPIGRADAPAALDAVLAGGLRKQPGDRYASAYAMGEALRTVERELGLPNTPMDVPSQEWTQVSAGDSTTGLPAGPVRSTVRIESARHRGSAVTGSSEGGLQRHSPATWWRIGLGVAIAVAVAVVALVVLL